MRKLIFCLCCLLWAIPACAGDLELDLECLQEAYPGFITGTETDDAGHVWFLTKNGGRLLYNDGKMKSHAELLENADIEDAMRQPYPLEPERPDFTPDEEPGRIRCYPLLKALYGADQRSVERGIVRTLFGGKIKVRLAAPAAEAAELAEETPLTPAVMPESPVMADSLTHGQRVAAIAATLFQDLAELHGLDDVWGHRLHLAAQLHDIGFAEGRKGHHKISMRLIEEDLSLNIHEDDRPWVALLARYHRKAWPSRRHARFDALKKSDRKALRKAASLLRIADALDYTHTGVVGNLAVAVKKHKVIIAVQCSGDCSAEMERVIKKGDLFMHVFGRELECVCQED